TWSGDTSVSSEPSHTEIVSSASRAARAFCSIFDMRSPWACALVHEQGDWLLLCANKIQERGLQNNAAAEGDRRQARRINYAGRQDVRVRRLRVSASARVRQRRTHCHATVDRRSSMVQIVMLCLLCAFVHEQGDWLQMLHVQDGEEDNHMDRTLL